MVLSGGGQLPADRLTRVKHKVRRGALASMSYLMVLAVLGSLTTVANATHGGDDWAHRAPAGWVVTTGYGGQHTVSNCDNMSAGTAAQINDANDATSSEFSSGFTSNCWGVRLTRTGATPAALTIRAYRVLGSLAVGTANWSLRFRGRPGHDGGVFSTVASLGTVGSVNTGRVALATPFVTGTLSTNQFADFIVLYTGATSEGVKRLNSFELYGAPVPVTPPPVPTAAPTPVITAPPPTLAPKPAPGALTPRPPTLAPEVSTPLSPTAAPDVVPDPSRLPEVGPLTDDLLIVPPAIPPADVTTDPAASSVPAATILPGTNVKIDRIELVQIVQSPDGSVPMVAGKKTLIRTFLTSDSVRIPVLKGSLKVNPNLRYFEATGGDFDNNTDAQANLSHTLNFIIPGAVTASGGNFTFDLGFIPEGGGEGDHKTFTVLFEKHVATVAYLPVCAPHGSCPDEAVIRGYGALMAKLYPVGEGDLRYARMPLPPFERGKNDVSEWHSLGGDLIIAHLFIPRAWGNHFLFWLPDLDEGPRGTAHANYALARVNSDPLFAQWVAAHELGHTFGLQHAQGCGFADNSNWPRENDPTIGAWGFDPDTETLVSPSANDLMSYCSPPSNIWISPLHYKQMMRRIPAHAQMAPDEQNIFADEAPNIDQVVIAGTVNAEGILKLSPVYHQREPANTVTPTKTNGSICARFRAATGTVLATNCVEMSERDHQGKALTNKVFAMRVAYPSGTTSVTINQGPKEVTRLSGVAPTVVLNAPSEKTWRGTQNLSWDAQLDVNYAVFYSPDDGEAWFPLSLDVKGGRFGIDTTQLAATSAARFRVVSSVGVNNAVTEIGPIELPEGRWAATPQGALPQKSPFEWLLKIGVGFVIGGLAWFFIRANRPSPKPDAPQA